MMQYRLDRDDEGGHRIVCRFSVYLNGKTNESETVVFTFPDGVDYYKACEYFSFFLAGAKS